MNKKELKWNDWNYKDISTFPVWYKLIEVILEDGEKRIWNRCWVSPYCSEFNSLWGILSVKVIKWRYLEGKELKQVEKEIEDGKKINWRELMEKCGV